MKLAHAIRSLCPSAEFSYTNNDYSTVIWIKEPDTIPTEAEITAEVARLQAEYDAQSYARSRASEYPPITDYIDGVVKGDQAQIDAYIAACQAVKAKYPKA